jgi:putative ABC transport system substrate-binding protein
MRRRTFVALIGSSTLAWPWPFASYAQPRDDVRRVSVLQSFDAIDPEAHRRMRAFRQALQELGWMEGQNL